MGVEVLRAQLEINLTQHEKSRINENLLEFIDDSFLSEQWFRDIIEKGQINSKEKFYVIIKL